MQTRRGQSIEDASMQVIEDEIGEHKYEAEQWQITRRVIHATADFDFARGNGIIFHRDAVASGIDAIRGGCNIIVDVNGVIGGLNKQNPRDFGNRIICRISDDSVRETARKSGITRSQTAMRTVKDEMNGGIVAVGNAPTALLEVIRMIQDKETVPALVIGIPVGFICAAEAKEELGRLDAPFITNTGRKGGSAAASAIINALYILARSAS